MTEPSSEDPVSGAETPSPSQPKLRLGRIIALLTVIILLPIGLSAAAILSPGPVTDTKTLVISHGMRSPEIGAMLESEQIIPNQVMFHLAVKILANGALQAGEYEFTPHQSLADIVLMMHEGHSVVRLYTVAEGLTSVEIVDLLKNNSTFMGDVTTIPADGSLLPESYRYSYGDMRSTIIERMQKAMQETLHQLWADRDTSIPLKTPDEALVMASIIEKETGKPQERPRIAGVFYNRLQKNMRLQSDPTVIYAVTHGQGPLDRELTHDDLTFPSPYNTYTNDGLPPKSICNPGRASIEAALHPENNDYLYFVADGTGGHVFAKDLSEHNQNVAKLVSLKKAQSIQ